MKHGKKYVDGAKLIERSRLYDTQEALDLCVKTGTAKFDETVEVHVKLGVDGRHADQQVRGAIVLPHGTGKTVRVLAICKPEKEDEARAAGAEFVGGNDMIQKIQSEGWTYEEFLEILKAGTTSDCFGFVFANSGVTASDVPNIMGVMAGLTNAFTDDLKYAFTSDNMLNLLNAIEEMTKAGYMPNYGVEAGQRMVMCQQGKAMIFGKAMPLFENNINKNNAALEANDGTAVENSIPVNYAFLPVPTMEGAEASCFGSVDGLIALRNNKTTDEHLKNVCLFLDYISSGERIAAVDQTLLLEPVCQTGRDAYVSPEGLDEGNVASAARCIGLVVAPPAGVTAEQSASAKTIMDEVIVPKFQALLAGEATAQEVYDAVCTAATEAFGADGCVSGAL